MIEIIKNKYFILFIILVVGVFYINNITINKYEQENSQIVYNN